LVWLRSSDFSSRCGAQNAGTKSIFDALNVAYGEKEKRDFIRLNLISFAFTIGALLFLLVAIAAVVVVPLILGSFGFLDTGHVILSLLRWPILFVLIAAGLSLLYRYGPSCAEAKWRWLTPGSALATVLWLLVFRTLLLVSRQFRQLQRHLRIARRADRADDVAVDLDDRRSRRSRARRRNRTSDRPRFNCRSSETARPSRGDHGGYGGRCTKLIFCRSEQPPLSQGPKTWDRKPESWEGGSGTAKVG
jgi:hypothetical protein